MTIFDAMILIAGAAFGLWLFQDALKFEDLPPNKDVWPVLAVALLGGISLASTPLILADRLRGLRRWRSGTIHWLAVGLACWGLMPALVIMRLTDASGAADACFIYSIPIMGLFLLIATLISPRSQSRWWSCRGHWSEWLGMWMLVGWSAVGGYVLFLIYYDLF